MKFSVKRSIFMIPLPSFTIDGNMPTKSFIGSLGQVICLLECAEVVYYDGSKCLTKALVLGKCLFANLFHLFKEGFRLFIRMKSL